MTGTAPLTQVNYQQRAPRVDINQLVSVTMFGGPALLLNLSTGGIAIQAMEVLQPGCLFSLRFPLPSTDCEVQTLGKVVWSDETGRAGLKFVSSNRFDRMCMLRWMHGRQQN